MTVSPRPRTDRLSVGNPDQGTDEASETTARVRELYSQHASALVRQLTRQSGCREVGRELAHETFVRLLRMPPSSLAQIQNPEALLRTIATNLLRDWRRVNRLRDRFRSALEIAPDPLVDQVAALESRDALRRLEHAVRQLKPRARETFLAHRLRGLSYAEIALRTGLSVKGVEKQLARAIVTIMRSLEGDGIA